MRDYEMMCNEDLLSYVAGQKIRECDNLSHLSQMTAEELMQIKGVSKITAKRIIAAFELGRRVLIEKNSDQTLDSSDAIYNFILPYLGGLDHEEVYAIAMNNALRVITVKRMSSGGYSSTPFDIRQILNFALTNKAVVLAVCHNHPSGRATPSTPDDNVTRDLHKSCDIMHIRMLDHIIVGDTTYYSYADSGRI